MNQRNNMRKYRSSSRYYELCIPDNWSYTEEGNIVSFNNEVCGVGAFQVSSYLIDKDQNIDVASELSNMLSDKIGVPKQDILPKISVTNNLAHFYFIDGEKYWEYYILFKNGKLLFITYNCQQTDNLVEKSIIDKIIHSIVL